ncbi:hypothetical protein FisN_8Lh229 [Fistulifera solaris]|uniref:Uncharacterized protein n=1 Tax=Fistulifera solaris TaxID=1519565 RepID=A0A1Z5JN79_FISSO|nr:hypothetical protein FisN_8Lh229 [Fistulifera solaris]|eukprot:GAX15470.1 hypothetical protein FisN_8Lh229 [Fistulifera solaris]
MSSNDMINRQVEHAGMNVPPMSSIGIPRTVSDDEIMTAYPAAKRKRDSDDASRNTMEVETFLPVSESLLSQDEVLIEMIQQSGAQSYADIVNFCVKTGIPLSRMFRLDLMRQGQRLH